MRRWVRRDPRDEEDGMTDHQLLTVEEAAAHLRLNPQTVYRLLRAGKLPGVKVGRQWRVRLVDLEAHLTSPPVNPAREGNEAAP